MERAVPQAASLGATRVPLACCHGYAVAAGERVVGVVETPTFADASAEPDYLIVRVCEPIEGAFRVVPVSLVDRVVARERTVTLRGDVATVALLPERLPLGREPLRGEGA